MQSLAMPRSSPWLLIAPLCVLSGAAVALVAENPFPDGSLLPWIVTLCVVALAPILAVPKGRRLSDLGVLFALAWALTFGVASLVWVHADLILASALWLPPRSIERAVALCTLGIGLFWLGYLPTVRFRVASPRPVSPRAIRWPRVWVVAALGLASSYALAKLGMLGYLASVENNQTTTSSISTALLLLQPALVFGLYASWIAHLTNPTRRSRRYVVVLGIGTLIYGAATGSKAPVLYPIIGLGLIHVVIRGRIPRRLIAIGAVALVVILPATELFRSSVAAAVYTDPGQGHFGSGPLRAITGSFGAGNGPAVERWISTRLQSADQVALIIDQTPSTYPYRAGSLWAMAPVYNVIPRALWPSKPNLDLETAFDHTYGHVPAELPTNSGLTYPGDLYANFGLAGVIVGMVALGVAMAWLTRRLRRTDRPWWLALFAVTALTLWQPDHSVTYALLVLPRQLLVGSLLVLWMFPKVRTKRRYLATQPVLPVPDSLT